ncbi:TonB-dependent receptor [Calditrichota bacterium GD2]
MKESRNILWSILILCLMVFYAHAGTTGKIAGIVIDKETGEPLAGVNVFIPGMNLGASTNINGEYYIIQVPPGIYTIKASMIGYATEVKKNVEVRVDLTTKVVFMLTKTILEGEEIVTIAERPLIQRDLTSSKRSSSKAEIENIPAAENAMDVLSVIPGAIVATVNPVLNVGGGHTLKAQDENIKNIHIRGGGGGEVLFQVDGMPVNHPIFGGHSVLNIDIKSVEEIEVLTGGFSAEYGEAQSGVINVITREGGEHYQADFTLKHDDFLPVTLHNSEGYEYGSFYLEGPEPLTSKWLPELGIKFLSNTYLFVSGSFKRTNTQFNNHRTRQVKRLLGFFNVKDKQYNEYTFNVKISHYFSPGKRLILNYQRNDSWWSNFDWGGKNIPDSLGDAKSINNYFVLSFKNTLSRSTFFNVHVSYLQVRYHYSLYGKTPDAFWRWVYNDITKNWVYRGANFFEDLNHDGFVEIGQDTDYRNDLSKVLTTKFDITSQINRSNLVKMGIEYQYKDLLYTNIQQGGWYLTPYGQYVFNGADYVPQPPGPFPEYGLFRWYFKAFPSQGAWYIQDKLENSGLIINAGLRYDWIMPGSSVEKESFRERWERVTGLKLNLRKFKGYFSPRLGISFPISVKTVMYFSYGHFQQMPSSDNLYRDPYSNTFCGNPDLDPQKTVAYEFGFAQQIGSDFAIDIKGYSKDISNTVVNGLVQPEKGRPIWLAQNMGYGRARGVEINLKKRYSGFTSGILTYTLQWANGYTSSPFELYQRSQTNLPLPIREHRLDWDKRHQLLLQFTIDIPKDKTFRVFGLKIPGNWSLTINSSASSGNPYTPGSTEIYVPPNSKTAPFIANTDLRFKKKWNIGKIHVGLTLDITNVFDRNNVNTGWGFNPWTGKPYVYGDVNNPFPYYYTWMEILRLRDPRMFMPGRRIVLGLNFGF